MLEKIIYLEGISPVDFYGINNSNYEKIKEHFPKLKIVGRGGELKIMGTATEVKKFETKVQEIINHFHHFNILSEEDLNVMLNEDNQTEKRPKVTDSETLVYGNSGKPIQARTDNQRKLVEASEMNDLLLAIGPAGTGKTYTAIALAVKAFKNKEIKRIILTRPAVEAGEHLGFLPGDVKEKLDPYLQPLYDALNDMIPAKKLEGLIEEGTIQIAPLAFMRGRTLENAFVILDEAQNATVNQLKMFLTRMGMNAKFIVTGDITQIDLPNKNTSGLLQAMRILDGIKGISIIQFNEKDIVRHKLVKDIVRAYDNEERTSKNGSPDH
jgi:phosphate starvation-inducible protein PhoH and related proteins